MKLLGLSTVMTGRYIEFWRTRRCPSFTHLPLIVILLLGFAIPSIALADVLTTGYGKITRIETGWYGEGVALHHSGNAIGGCSADPMSLGLK